MFSVIYVFMKKNKALSLHKLLTARVVLGVREL